MRSDSERYCACGNNLLFSREFIRLAVRRHWRWVCVVWHLHSECSRESIFHVLRIISFFFSFFFLFFLFWEPSNHPRLRAILPLRSVTLILGFLLQMFEGFCVNEDTHRRIDIENPPHARRHLNMPTYTSLSLFLVLLWPEVVLPVMITTLSQLDTFVNY